MRCYACRRGAQQVLTPCDSGCVSGAGTADEFIEAEVRALMMSKDPPVVYVATSDRVSGDVSFGSGAVMINSDQFIRNIIKTDEEACASS